MVPVDSLKALKASTTTSGGPLVSFQVVTIITNWNKITFLNWGLTLLSKNVDNNQQQNNKITNFELKLQKTIGSDHQLKQNYIFDQNDYTKTQNHWQLSTNWKKYFFWMRCLNNITKQKQLTIITKLKKKSDWKVITVGTI